MSYYSQGGNRDDEASQFEEYDPTPYGGGYDLILTYGRPLPPSHETCYSISSSGSPSVDYDRPYHSFNSHTSSAYGGQVASSSFRNAGIDGYSQRKPEDEGETYSRPQPNYGFSTGLNRPGTMVDNSDRGSRYDDDSGMIKVEDASYRYGDGLNRPGVYGQQEGYSYDGEQTGYAKRRADENPSWGKMPNYHGQYRENEPSRTLVDTSPYHYQEEQEQQRPKYEGQLRGEEPSEKIYGSFGDRDEEELPRRQTHGRTVYEEEPHRGSHGRPGYEQEPRTGAYLGTDYGDEPRRQTYERTTHQNDPSGYYDPDQGEGYARPNYGNDSDDDEEKKRRHHKHHHHRKYYDDE